MVMALGYVSIQNEPTRDQNCLDHVLVRSNRMLVEANVLQHMISDHAMLNIAVEIQGNLKFVDERVNRVNYEKLKINLRNQNWDWVKIINNKDDDVNKHFTKFFNLIQKCIDQSTITRKSNSRKFQKRRQP